MKKLILLIGLIFSISYASNATTGGENDNKKKVKVEKSSAELPMVVYANLSCQLPDGSWGCQCAITASDDDCEVQTECTSADNLPAYKEALLSMFSEDEINLRAANKVRITEPVLINALKKDGFPVK